MPLEDKAAKTIAWRGASTIMARRGAATVTKRYVCYIHQHCLFFFTVKVLLEYRLINLKAASTEVLPLLSRALLMGLQPAAPPFAARFAAAVPALLENSCYRCVLRAHEHLGPTERTIFVAARPARSARKMQEKTTKLSSCEPPTIKAKTARK